jgi:hypothetical protein
VTQARRPVDLADDFGVKGNRILTLWRNGAFFLSWPDGQWLTATSRWNPWQVAAPNRRRQHAIVVMIADRVRAGQTWTIGRDLLPGDLDAPASFLAGMDRVRL